MLKALVSYVFPILFLVMGIVTFAAYGIDKRAAKKGQRRIPEKTLWLMNICGGFVGGWLGMFTFNHKTRHASFYVVQAFSLILWVLLWSILWVKGLNS